MTDSLKSRCDILDTCLCSWALAIGIIDFMCGNNFSTLSLIKLIVFFLEFLGMEYR